MRKVAVTGGLSSGKTTVCQLFAELGAYVVNSDEIVHQLFTNDDPLRQKIVQLFGHEVIGDHQINRKEIAKIAFSRPELLRTLERLVHPIVFHEIDKRCRQAQAQAYPLFIAEVPLLYESEKEEEFDDVVVVLAPEKLARKRFASRESNDFDIRMNQQIDPEKKAARADFVIVNDGDIEQLKLQVKVLYLQLSRT